ncbi:MAG: S8 family serine peptidase [Proteobacteria bacterium]|nr:S8 family serine peptidase [Pseudomonadota bacterium]
MKFSQTFLQKIKRNGMLSAILGLLLLTASLSPIVSSDVYAVSNTLVEEKNSPENKTLAAKANKDGSVRIIVRVKTTQAFQPMADTLSAPAIKQMGQIDSAQESVLRGLAGHRVLNSYKFRYTPYLSMTVDSATLDALLASPDILQVQEDTLSAPTLDLSIPRIGASNLHSSNIKGTGITIAVLDTGVDKLHPFLSGSVVSEACYSTNYLAYSSTTICPGGVTESTVNDSAIPYISGICPAGKCDHGTHVAGIAGGRQSISGSPGPGVAPEADIIAVQVFSRFDNEDLCGVGKSPCALSYTSDQMKGLERIYELRDTYTIASVNMSLGGGKYSSYCDTNSLKASIDNLRAAGIATIIASGNDGYCGSISAPACISSAISVGATDDVDNVAGYSNSATFMSLFAPGSTINSSIPDSAYTSWNGTSMATPHVTGTWALLKQQRPDASVADILSAFQATGLSITDGNCPVTKKRINVLEAANFMTAPSYTLNVNSSGASSVAITGNPVIYSGTTNYSESGITPDTDITLTAPSTSGIATFNNWSGCDSTASTECTVSMTEGKTVIANYTPDVIELQNGVTVSNLSGAQDEMLDYYIAVPTGTRSLTVQTWGGIGDADIYARYGSRPTTDTWDYRSWSDSTTESIIINNPQAGNWYISVNGWAAFSGVSLKAKFGSPWLFFFIPAILSKQQ